MTNPYPSPAPQGYYPPQSAVPGAAPQGYYPQQGAVPGAAPQGYYPQQGVVPGAVPQGYYPPQGAVPGAVPQRYYPQQGAAPGTVPQGYSVPPAQGWIQPCYYPQPAQPAPPVFTGPGPVKDPLGKAASRDMNRMSLLALAQMALSTGWGYILGILCVVLGINLFASDSYGMSMITSLIVVLSTGLVPFLFFVAGRKNTADYLKFQKTGFFPSLLCVLAGSALMILGNILANILYTVLEGADYQPTVLETSEDIGTWLGFLIDFATIAVLGPMLEEVMDRGIFIGTLRKYGIGFSVAASALLFGLAHLELGTVVFAINAGLVLGFLYARTNNLWLTIWIHMINNGAVILTRYSGLICPQNPDLFSAVLELSLLGLGGLSLLLLLIFYRRIFITRRSPQYDGPQQPLSFGRAAAAIAKAPLFWALAAIVAVYFIVLLV